MALRTAAYQEMTEYLRHQKRSGGNEVENVRNGGLGKMVLTEHSGQASIQPPEPSDKMFETPIIRKRQRQ
jgi:transposase-like protein